MTVLARHASGETTFHSTYFGCNIYRQSGGYRLPWLVIGGPRGSQLAADTLAGIRELIREERDQ